MEEQKCPSCSGKIKHRSEKEHDDLIKRLNRIEGQVRGVKKMINEDKYCIDIINQVNAITAALNGFNKQLLSAHIQSCVVEDIKNDNLETVDELCSVLQKLMR
ncbi:DNA-binding FrmR family transcriptional regulator [Clostridiales Family XIII bacterium PM5-7]